MPIKLKTNASSIDLKVPIKQLGGGAVDSVNGMTGDVVLDIPSKTSQLENDSGFLTQHQDVSSLATKSEVKAVEDKIPSLEGYATEQWVEAKGYLTEHQSLENYALRSEIPTKTSDLTNDSGYLTEHQSLADYATKAELAAKQDTLTAGDNITIENGVISASGGSSGSCIKSIRFRTGKIAEEETASQFKEWLTYLWDIGNGSYVDLSKCIVTIDGQVMNSVYCRNIGTSQYIYFYPAVSSNFDNSDKLTRYYYVCDYLTAMTKTQDYSYINKTQYATTLLTSDNYTQYISTSGNYTTDVSDSNLYNAVELYICIYSGSNYAFLYIKPEQNLTFSSCTYQNYAYSINNAVHSLYYDGNNLVINDGVDDSIKFIWYK